MVLLFKNAPLPFKYVTLFFLNNPSMPLVSDVTIPDLFYWVLDQFTPSEPTYKPIALKSWFASWYLWEMFSRALDGIQPTLRQVPPSDPLFSMQTVFKPNWAALMAAT
jgi:hypothetical protein